ncbi:LacI family DNA-binding transcriptional regulator [Gordonia malaquae]|uniref:LacI family DNA-binding transcriptional regulator n=1 Tax=Gordonia malaquae TaxID=410332 RepID=UPI00301B1FDA
MTTPPEKALKRPTLADVARVAGTSTAVVSYVINDGPRPVSAPLRAKVTAALESLDYRPDRRAQALRRPRRWQQVGLLVPDLAMPLFAAYAQRFESAGRARGNLTLIGSTGFDADRELEFARSFTQVGVDGLIVVGSVAVEATADLCRRSHVPVVWTHSMRGSADRPVVSADHRLAGRLVGEHLTRIHQLSTAAFIGGVDDAVAGRGDRETVAQRLDGLIMSGLSVTVAPTDLTAPSAYRAVRDLLVSETRPDAIVPGTLGQTDATIRAITDAGLAIPHDIALASFDGPDSAYREPVPTTAVLPVDAVVDRALDALEFKDVDECVSGVTLRIGQTCGCPADRSELG